MLKLFMKLIVLATVVAGIAAAVYVGLIDTDKLEAEADNLRLSAEHAVGNMMGEIKPQPSIRNSPQCAAACRQNLHDIESAKRRLMKSGDFATGTFSWSDIRREMGGRVPRCPCGGTYSIGTSEQLPSCSIGAGGSTDKRLRHSIKRY